ncbi:hypothetical protein NC797_11315 [Aquibacillus sp. 3ASR75-11]|uniref:Uncharacterized protein n=1 Tax=Terrihalobacillus insolitus TaxID=2950438 RepID=A0A9X4AP20_9BACI|nr:hypothetical protein [Terrihalobacillus insolitus]MDC3425095.1 hypothetical protein [Terrihalobacillus insolitus]
MKQLAFRIIPAIIVGVIVLLSFSNTTEAERRYKYGAKTPPPVEEMNIDGFFNSNHQYLLDGTNLLTIYNSDYVRIEGTTYAKQYVDTIGVTFYLQKWNGVSWEYTGAGTTYSGSKRDVFDKTVLRSAEAGYYYRLKTRHWISHNGVYEQGERVSDYILMK